MESSEIDLQNAIKSKLKSKMFLGIYRERRLIEKLNQYRDVISLHVSEAQLLHDLRDCERMVEKVLGSQVVCGFSTENEGAIFCDELSDTPLGTFWFQVRAVKFRSDEVSVRLKVIRQVGFEEQDLTSPVNVSREAKKEEGEKPPEWEEILQSYKGSIEGNVKEFLAHQVNSENIKKVLKFLALLVVSASVASIELVKWLGNFTIRFMAEVSKFVRVSTPIFMAILDFFSRIVGGMFIFLAMLWRDSIGKGPAIRPPERPALEYRKPYKSVYYDRKPIEFPGGRR